MSVVYVGYTQDKHGVDVEVEWNKAAWLEPLDTLDLVGTHIQTKGLKPLNVAVYSD